MYHITAQLCHCQVHPTSAYTPSVASAAGDTPRDVCGSTEGLVNRVMLANVLSNNLSNNESCCVSVGKL